MEIGKGHDLEHDS